MATAMAVDMAKAMAVNMAEGITNVLELFYNPLNKPPNNKMAANQFFFHPLIVLKIIRAIKR